MALVSTNGKETWRQTMRNNFWGGTLVYWPHPPVRSCRSCLWSWGHSALGLKALKGHLEKTSRRETLAMESKPYKGWGFAAVSSFCCCTNLWGWWSGHIDSSSRNRLGRFCKNFKYICIIITLSWTSVVSLLIAGLVSLVGQFDRKNGGASIYSQGCGDRKSVV